MKTPRGNGWMDNRTTVQVQEDPKKGRSMHNRKPFRTHAQKIEARNKSELIDGRYVCYRVPVSYHSAPKTGDQ